MTSVGVRGSDPLDGVLPGGRRDDLDVDAAVELGDLALDLGRRVAVEHETKPGRVARERRQQRSQRPVGRERP